jgi:hypothetical protein
MMRVTAMQGQNLRAGDLALRTEGGRTWVTLHRVLGKTMKTDARGTATVQEDTSAGRRVSQLLGELHQEAVAARGVAGALLVRGTGVRHAAPGAPWTPASLTAVLRRQLAAVGVVDASRYSTKSLKSGAVTEARELGAPDAEIARRGDWKSSKWRSYDASIPRGGVGAAVPKPGNQSGKPY